jgi:hypothetical protein
MILTVYTKHLWHGCYRVIYWASVVRIFNLVLQICPASLWLFLSVMVLVPDALLLTGRHVHILSARNQMTSFTLNPLGTAPRSQCCTVSTWPGWGLTRIPWNRPGTGLQRRVS